MTRRVILDAERPPSADESPLRSAEPEASPAIETNHWMPSQYEFDSRSLRPSKICDASDPRSGASRPCAGKGCIVPLCTNTLEGAYYKKYKICEEHAKSPAVTIEGLPVRFCQKCGRFQDLSIFDGSRRSCRHSLEAHNRRRRAKHASSTKDKPWRHAKKEKSPLQNPTREASQRRSKSLPLSDDAELVVSELEGTYGRPQLYSLDELQPDISQAYPKMSYAASQLTYRSDYEEHTLSLKFHGSTPEELPDNLLNDIQLQLPMYPETAWCEGSMRPGCTHVSLRVRVMAGNGAGGLTGLSTEQLAAGLSKAWRGHKSMAKGMEVQIGNSATHVGKDGSLFTMSALPEFSVFPSVAQSGVRAEFDVVLENIQLRDRVVVIFCRQHGKYLTTSIVHDEDEAREESSEDADVCEESDECADPDTYDEAELCSNHSTESSRSVSGRNSIESDDTVERAPSGLVGSSRRLVRVFGLTPGSCEIEVMVDNILTSSVSVLVLPNSDCVHDARRLMGSMPEALVPGFIRDIGLVVRHVYSPHTLLPSDLSTVQRLATKACDWAMENCSSHLISILQEALPPDNARCCNSMRMEKEVESGTGMLNGRSKETEITPLDLKVPCPTGIQIMSGKPYGSYEIDIERAIVQELCAEVSDLGIGEKRSLQKGSGWKNFTWQLLFGAGLIFLAGNK